MSKRKRVVLTFQQKLEILQQLDEGKSGAILAKEYNIGTSTISDIKRNSDTIRQFVSNLECSDQISAKKTRKTAQNTDLDSKIFRWYSDEKKKGVPPPDAAVCAKALEVNKELNGNENFKASSGWLRHFKNRHGLRDAKEENEEVVVCVGKQLRNVVKRGGYTLENVYSADDGFLLWKSLPGFDKNECVAVITCSNANGSHKLPLCVIGRERKQFYSPSCVYKHQETDNFFEEWFEEYFLEHVRNRQQLTGNYSKILMIFDDAPWHPPRDVLLKTDVDVFVKPAEAQIRHLKQTYRTKLLTLLAAKSYPIKQFLEEFTLTESIPVIGEAWDSIPRAHIVDSWGKLLSNVKNDTMWEPPDISGIVGIAQTIPGLEHYNSEELHRWLDCDKDCYYLNSEEESEESAGPSNDEAYQCFDTVIQWVIRQEECNREQLEVLESLRDLAGSKMYGDGVVKQEME